MNKDIKNPIFIIIDDGTVEFLHEEWKVDCCSMEPIDVEDGLYTAYDSEGQILELVIINKKGEIERPAENIINIPFLGPIVLGTYFDKSIKAIPTGIKDKKQLKKMLARDLSGLDYKVDGLKLNELVAIYEKNNKKTL